VSLCSERNGSEEISPHGATREEIKSLIVSQWAKRTDRGAEERKDLVSRGVLVGIQQLRKDPTWKCTRGEVRRDPAARKGPP